MKIKARDYRDSLWIELEIRLGRIIGIRAVDGPGLVRPGDDWVAPAFWDIQVNGRLGHSFASPDLTVEQVVAIARAQFEHGTARFCPTVMTAPAEHMLHGVRTIATACAEFPDVAATVFGIHLEGPFLSAEEGYRGAHPPEHMRDPDWEFFRELQTAAAGQICLVTLAPERTGTLEFIRRATRMGVVVALGHTAADGPTIAAAAHAGARLSTHLGNGIPEMLRRHPNPIWEQAALDSLSASLIADGHHLDPATLRTLARAKGHKRTILVSDASPLAGLPAGTYGDWTVDPAGKIVVAGTPYLAGSNQGVEVGLGHLRRTTNWSIEQTINTVAANPARLLDCPPPRLAPGEPANVVLLRQGADQGVELRDSYLAGKWWRR